MGLKTRKPVTIFKPFPLSQRQCFFFDGFLVKSLKQGLLLPLILNTLVIPHYFFFFYVYLKKSVGQVDIRGCRVRVNFITQSKKTYLLTSPLSHHYWVYTHTVANYPTCKLKKNLTVVGSLVAVMLKLCNYGVVHFMHLADAFIQNDLQCIQVIHVLSVCVFPGNWTHDLCAANAML